MRRLVLRAITGYQRWISPLIGMHCRYVPTCSRYTAEAVERFGVIRGLCLGICRVARCHPFTEGGLDPVPEQWHWRACLGARHRFPSK
ncbi:MAG: membrane protein insertion efficiency factor YidD [Verrucomicrobiota bacterium]|nr:membrane protein insertion efficiency factor YidD [Verrucomicrobiota bacterium]MDD8050447.1 membrane protein insertion efficiency factor YidD [Verrucomicrobiota bacterium]MDI9384711.1 membrane protein insertion efficiency factor YidD [Verrucomicrobiota bacterium]HCF93776.1 membrane protein insertion efficiency factor YidD [Verrucomicrobiota bacterium]